MTRQTRPVPGLFGGISQQISALRHPTHCEAQRNMLATTVDGLFMRPGAASPTRVPALDGANGASVLGSGGEAHAHFFEDTSGRTYVLVLVNGNLMLYDAETGTEQVVSFPNGRGYLNSIDPTRGFSCVTLADYTFVANRTAVPAMAATTTPLNATNVVYVHLRKIVADQTYSIQVDAVAATQGVGTGSSFTAVLASLQTQLSAGLGAGYSVVLIAGANCLRITKTAGLPVVTLNDTWDNSTMKLLNRGVETYADLPPSFETNYTLTILGTAADAEDPYYVKWDGTRWVEALKPGLKTSLSITTMPHQLYRTGPTTWSFEAVPDWGLRLVGDDNTNPEPTFIGSPIRAVFFYRNRLGFLSADSLLLSRAGRFFDFFATTAVQVLDTDPVDLAAPVGGVNYLSHATPFNQTLVVWTDAAQQLELASGDVLSPKTARLVPSTTFSMDPATKPGALGNRAVFCEKGLRYAQLSAYRVAPDAATNVATKLSAHVPRLLPKEPRQLVPSTAVEAVAVLPFLADSEFHLLNYELDEGGEEYKQKAWSSHKLAGAGTQRIVAGHWKGQKLILLVYRLQPGEAVAAGRYFLETLDFQKDAVDDGLDYALCLDRKVRLSVVDSFNTVANQTAFVLPYRDASAVFYQCTEGAHPIPLTPVSVVPHISGGSLVTLPGDLRLTGARAGVPFEGSYTFTEALVRDKDGIPLQSATLKLLKYYVRVAAASSVRAEVTPYLRGTFRSTLSAGAVVDAPTPFGSLLLATGDFTVPVQAQARGTVVTLLVSGPLRATIPYAEWVGEVTVTASR